ncbi:hypothetical protein G7075_02800 [Phycicoccus sp. HDW14]|uniref:hypothetical protein n=1 Tax=Phycicoccus sp. HDW14 TaxID=2714941 RepID=UPI00140A3CE2|nr:hypothetical protein [Phycicoccus sp. HDW14]QIM20320.1 hypothetical protein G7075_02800 [Phycicoccus sp. HDW14]
MLTTVTRVAGALLALAGLALTVVGVWFATSLGGSGTAEFTTRPATGQPVVIPPDVLNRVDADVVVTARPTSGASVWMALANPSDARAVLGDARHQEVSGVSVRDWTLTTTSRGTGQSPTLGTADLWRQQDDAEGPVTLTVEQADAPESLVVAADGGDIASLTLRVVDKTWFVESVVAALVGLFLLVAGVVVLWPRRGHHPAAADAAAAEEPDAAAAEQPDGAAAQEPDTGAGPPADPPTSDDQEVAR